MTGLQDNEKYIGQLLVKDGVITSEELGRGLTEQKKTKDFLCSTIVRLGFATEEKIYSILSLQIGVPYVNLKEVKIDPGVLNRMPGRFALSRRCVPIKEDGGMFYIAMADPMNNQTVKEIKTRLKAEKLKVFLSGDIAIHEALKTYYGV